MGLNHPVGMNSLSPEDLALGHSSRTFRLLRGKEKQTLALPKCSQDKASVEAQAHHWTD